LAGVFVDAPQGTQWSEDLGVAPFDVRRRAASLHNGKDVIIVASGDKEHDYEDLLAQSVFCLVQRGGASLTFLRQHSSVTLL
jgi:hypothetical protein